ncbi:MAG: chromosome segregation protein SMC [Gammaproteobacteria bacterium]|nr:chromosome segregation protein SMC [Gammaproteobacteria bacterium]
MRLSKIKLAGFKSFVDPTTITFPSNLIGIVGPNGCGKSNIIDAVRWVMGESSAKHLRGDSMADVVFNGSSSRKPVGTASIELIFDNADGTVGGQYANYAEISIKRQVSRDGTSTYFLNGTRCRRRDITDIFLGTGLGSRSYAIIEQGMISRLIEAKPEELRVYLEEAAGISKYKERRRETENRIRHTRENIERLDDLRSEIEKQIQHLQRQAKTAERYKGWRQEERRFKAELLALRWQALDQEVVEKDREIAEQQNKLEAAIAEQRAIENRIEQTREQHTEANDGFNEVQGRYYGVGADIARIEQGIQHAKELRGRQEKDLRETEEAWQDIQEHIKRDRDQVQQVEHNLREMEPNLQTLQTTEREASEALATAEERMQAWQNTWDEFVRDSSEATQEAEIERTQIEHLERRSQQVVSRLEKLKDERAALSSKELEAEISKLGSQESMSSEERERLQGALQRAIRELSELREDEKQLTTRLHETRSRLEDNRGRLSSLEALQQSALGKSKDAVNKWLAARKLANLPRLAQQLQVEDGWEKAVETVLGFHLEAVCVEQLDTLTPELSKLADGAVTIFETMGGHEADKGSLKTLAAKVKSELPVTGLLAGIYAVEQLADAVKLRGKLKTGESVVTRDGIWMGQNWVRVNRESDERAGVIAREQETKQLQEEQTQLKKSAGDLTLQQDELRARLKSLEERREELQTQVNQAHRQSADLHASLDTKRSKLDQLVARAREIDAELEDLRDELQNIESESKASRAKMEASLNTMESLEDKRGDLEGERNSLRENLENARRKAKEDRDALHDLALKVESRRSMLESTRRSLERLDGQLTQLSERRVELQKNLKESADPMDTQQKELESYLQKRSAVESELTQARKKLEELDEQIRNLEQDRAQREKASQQLRDVLESLKLGSQEIRVRKQTLNESLKEMNYEIKDLFTELPDDASIEDWEQKLDKMTQKIQRLGAINLAAIEEFSEQSERKQYLDAQHTDLTEALATLENAIRKIDRETRTRFKETFDKVNSGIKTAFPRLFGGGHAYLELTGEDLLDSGVTVMARPPGKRNSTIHLLSGGEKALTAVALVFAIFQLNPAPFCLLDEVDAPLDDYNVGRFCDLVSEMSERTQFVFITHNKITMEMAHQLTGVTMNEPGVSRLVAVDIDEAVQMAAV